MRKITLDEATKTSSRDAHTRDHTEAVGQNGVLPEERRKSGKHIQTLVRMTPETRALMRRLQERLGAGFSGEASIADTIAFALHAAEEKLNKGKQ